MASWLQSKLKAAESLLEAVDQTAKVTREQHGSGTSGVGAGAVSQLWNLAAPDHEADKSGTPVPSVPKQPATMLAASGAEPKAAVNKQGSGSLSRQGSGTAGSKPKAKKVVCAPAEAANKPAKSPAASGSKPRRPSATDADRSDDIFASLGKPGPSDPSPTPRTAVTRGAPPAAAAASHAAPQQATPPPPPAPAITIATHVKEKPWPDEFSMPPPISAVAASPAASGPSTAPDPPKATFQAPVSSPFEKTATFDKPGRTSPTGTFSAEPALMAPDAAVVKPSNEAGHQETADTLQNADVHQEEPEAHRASEEQQEEPAEEETLVNQEEEKEENPAEEENPVEEENAADEQEAAEAEVAEQKESVEVQEEAPLEHASPEEVPQEAPVVEAQPVATLVPSGGSLGGGSAATINHDLEQARELAKVADTQGSSREARLQRICDKLRARLEELKAENEQLEDLLRQAEGRASGGAGEADRANAELRRARSEHEKAGKALEAKLASAEAEAGKHAARAEKCQAQIDVLENKLAELQTQSEELLRERQSNEGRLMAALREELAGAEARLDEERQAHSLSRKAAATRQEQLEGDLSESASALTSLQRSLDDRISKIEDLESCMATLEDELEKVQSSLRRSEEETARERARADANSSDVLEAQAAAWKDEAEKCRKAQLSAEDNLEVSQREQERLSKQVKELEAVAQDVRGAADEDLSRRFKEVTELLYLKQTQLERMAAEKAAQQLSLEREVSSLRDELEKAKRRSRPRDPMETYSGEMTPMDTMGSAYQQLANHAQVGVAVKGFAKAVDVTAANAMRVMREYPLARVVFFLYSIFIHLFVYILIQRLQNRLMLVDDNTGDPGMP